MVDEWELGMGQINHENAASGPSRLQRRAKKKEEKKASKKEATQSNQAPNNFRTLADLPKSPIFQMHGATLAPQGQPMRVVKKTSYFSSPGRKLGTGPTATERKESKKEKKRRKKEEKEKAKAAAEEEDVAPQIPPPSPFETPEAEPIEQSDDDSDGGVLLQRDSEVSIRSNKGKGKAQADYEEQNLNNGDGAAPKRGSEGSIRTGKGKGKAKVDDDPESQCPNESDRPASKRSSKGSIRSKAKLENEEDPPSWGFMALDQDEAMPDREVDESAPSSSRPRTRSVTRAAAALTIAPTASERNEGAHERTAAARHVWENNRFAERHGRGNTLS